MNSRFFELSHDLLLVVAKDTSERRLNQAWERALGWPTDEIESRPISEIMHPDDLSAARPALDDLLSGAQPSMTCRIRFRTRDGQYRLIDWHATNDDVTGCIYGAGHDVTDEAELTHELARREETLSHLVAQLVRVREEEQARVAGELHDSALQHGIAALMCLEDPGEGDVEHARDQVRACVDALRQVITGLETSTDLRSGLDDAAHAIVQTVAHQFRIDVDLCCELDTPVPAEVAATACRALREGLVNVGKHSGRRRARVSISLSDDRHLVVEIADDGATERGEADTTTADTPAPARGAGFGLAALREVVRMQRGTLDVAISGTGSVLTARLPLDEAAATERGIEQARVGA